MKFGSAVIVTLLLVLCASQASAQDRADSAWTAGALELAESLYAARLAADSSDERALHRMALMFAWAGRYHESIVLFDRLIRQSPRNFDARRDRARVLAWQGDHVGALDGFSAILDAWPGDRETLLAMAQVLSWADRLDSAMIVYRGILALNPADPEAMKGLARVTGWSGDLRLAETRWRNAVELDRDDAEAAAGLAQTLRWQNRHARASEVLGRMQGEARENADVRRERSELNAVIGPRTRSALIHERDSDGNRIGTLLMSAGWRPVMPVDVVATGYLRWTGLSGSGLAGRSSRGGMLDARAYLDPGWTVFGGLGQSRPDATDVRTLTSWNAGVTTPPQYPLGGTLTVSRIPLDATTLLIERGVEITEWSVSGRIEPVSPWSASVGFSHSTFHGSEDNRRLAGIASMTRRLPGRWAVSAVVRAFGFEQDLTDGYFDPDFYGLAEARFRWQPILHGWQLSLEGAPGVQKVGSEGTVRATLRATGNISRALGPGREVSLGALFMNAGLQSFATGESDYRYLAFTLSGSWALGVNR